jgi:hypothetical protein
MIRAARTVILWLMGVVAALALAIAYPAYLQLTGNFYVVSPGTAYRAAQMDGQALVQWTQDHGIASVLNLRGANPGPTGMKPNAPSPTVWASPA